LTSRAIATACANIALVKYWGKQGKLNGPATPSIGLNLDALSCETVVESIDSSEDSFQIDGRILSGNEHTKLAEFLDLWREQKLIDGRFSVTSRNAFPGSAGLASSAAGFAALSRALTAFSKKKISDRVLSGLARRGSGSAARSIHGGVVALPASDDPRAKQLMKPEDVPWGMVVCVVDEEEKEVSSRDGMNLSRRTSPLYRGWVRQSKRDFRAARDAVRRRDLTRLGRIAEENMLAMHAVMISTRPPLIYWREKTLSLIALAARLRNEGLECWATIDAGPNVMLLARQQDLEAVREHALVLFPKDDHGFGWDEEAVKIGRPGSGAVLVSVE